MKHAHQTRELGKPGILGKEKEKRMSVSRWVIALLAALFIGIEATVVKKLSGREPVFQILLVSNGAGAFVTSLLMIAFWQPPNNEQWFLLVLIGLTMLCAQSLYVPGLRMGEASFVVPFSYSTLLFAAFYDLFFFNVNFNTTDFRCD